MKREKWLTNFCIVLSIVFSLSVGIYVHFKWFMPRVNSIYERDAYYSEELYEDYQKEADAMIEKNEFSCKYPTQVLVYPEGNQTTLVLQVGDYANAHRYADYLTVTVKNFGTDNQEITYERSRKGAQEAYQSAKKYKSTANIITLAFAFTLIIFTFYLIINAIKKEYRMVFAPMFIILGGIIVIGAVSSYFASPVL